MSETNFEISQGTLVSWAQKSGEAITSIVPEFKSFSKIPRLYSHVIITEKIDGTNACVHVDGAGNVRSASRNRWITTDSDNYGFARWVEEHKLELASLGEGYHYGEWAGVGIQRGYVTNRREFFLFRYREDLPSCCRLVPILYSGEFFDGVINIYEQELKMSGSQAFPGSTSRPEGMVIYHSQAKQLFKVVFENNPDKHKGE